MVTRSWPLFLFLLLCAELHFNPSLAYSLKNCTFAYYNNAVEPWVGCTGRSLTSVPDDIPKNATSLDLSFNLILRIHRADLSSLSKLRYLEIGNNEISDTDDGAFADLAELKQLDMVSNNLTKLKDNMFQGLGNLISLSLEKNYIKYISPLAFQPLVSVQRVILRYNRLQQMSDIVPVFQMPNLHELVLDYNEVASFQSDDLSFVNSNLRSLWLVSNLLTKFSITKDIFPQLQSIHLSTNTGFEWDVAEPAFLRSLVMLDLFVFDISCEMFKVMLNSTESLQVLSLSFMEYRQDEALIDVACKNPNVTSLNLSGNDFVSINDTFLHSCSHLTELSLSSNFLEELSEFSLSSMKQLQHLNLNQNSLNTVPLAIRGLSALQFLDLSSNFIGVLGCSDFLNLSSLTKLLLNQNSISVLRACVFENLKQLKVLNLRENKVHVLVDFFKVKLQKLEVLDLHGNNLRQLKTGDFTNLTSLVSLDLEGATCYMIHKRALEGLNQLQTLTITPFFYDTISFTGMPYLENLNLHLKSITVTRSSEAKNKSHFSNLHYLKNLMIKNVDLHFQTSPDLLKGLRSLESFVADQVFTASPHPDTFKYTPHLTSLQIIQSDLTELNPEVFLPIPNLLNLNLSKNQLRSLDFLAQVDLPALRYLILSNNEISVINETVFQSLPALTYLDLDNNPFICDCSNAGFIQWVKSNNQTQVVNAYQYTCSFPEAEHGQKLLDFDIGSCWMDFGFLCFISSTCLVVLTLVTSFVYHFLRWQLAYTFYLLLAFLYDSRKKKKGAPHQYDAFISYNVHDEPWVHREMLPALEGEQGWRLCLHHRDFQPGKPIIENITDAIYGSRKTICVISRRYLQSEWCSREIQMASFRLFDEQKDVLILLFLEDIPAWQMSPYHRMRKLVKKRTYLSWPQAGGHSGVFWENVRRALETGDAPMENTNLLTGPGQ
ncbi:toll-like receptor 13 [Mastacembelus armatus]|uniref:Toll-like receptor 13 n=1 Tax=Mastacembelus armatus TaxID=205130 RepID=A0A3Q3N961_9TELE|nr:toll-like receptor 13 [Mastacembelus armatus]